jgi:hypothetical protein
MYGETGRKKKKALRDNSGIDRTNPTADIAGCGCHGRDIDAARLLLLPTSVRHHIGVHIGSARVWAGRRWLGGVLDGVAPGHAVVPQHVARPQQVAGVAVQGRVRRRVRQQRQNGAAHALQRPGGRPRALQDVEADLARLLVGHSGGEVVSEWWASWRTGGCSARATQSDTSPSSVCWGETPAEARQASRACDNAAEAQPVRESLPRADTHLGDKLHLRRRQRVLLWYVQRQLEGAALIWRARRALDERQRACQRRPRSSDTSKELTRHAELRAFR